MPVEAGVADQSALAAGAEQEAVLAGGEEAAEEAAVALVVDLRHLVEALVGGDQRQQLLELRGGDRGDLDLSGHRVTVARRKAAVTSRDSRAGDVNGPHEPVRVPV